MEITNEIKERVITPYLHQLVVANEYDKSQLSVLKLDNLWQVIMPSAGGYFLKLRPLSSITDEDAIECAKIKASDKVVSNWTDDDWKDEAKYIRRNLNDGNIHFLQYQFLQSKGYDLPHYLLNGKTLHECNLCIYE